MSERSTRTEDGEEHTFEDCALAAFTLAKEKDFDGLLLPPLVALSPKHLVDIIADFLCLLFDSESLFAVRSGLVRGREKGGA